MKVSDSRAAAFDILLRVESRRAYSSELLHSGRLKGLSPPDQNLCTEIVMGVLRWRSKLDAAIDRFCAMPFAKVDLEVLTALRMGIYQLKYLDRIPARAAIHESVELVKSAGKRSAAALVNAVLRKTIRVGSEDAAAGPTPRTAGEELACRYAHPAWLVERWVAQYGAETAAAICRFGQTLPAVALRLRDPGIEEELRDEGIALVPGAILNSARRVLSGNVARSSACRERRAFIQDEASQLVAVLLGQAARILDCCAAPGGKTAAIAARNPQAEIVALELHEHRARLLRRFVGALNVRVFAADARALPLAGKFDRVLVDAPCSGTGTLARNPEIKWRLRAEDLADLHARQVEILFSAVQHLAPGGRLIYATCSLEQEENEDVVAELLRRTKARMQLVDAREELLRLQSQGELAAPEVTSLLRGPFLRTIPGVHACDGFFAAIMESRS